MAKRKEPRWTLKEALVRLCIDIKLGRATTLAVDEAMERILSLLPKKVDHMAFLVKKGGKIVEGRTMHDWQNYYRNKTIDEISAILKEVPNGKQG